ncbi:site-specific DNA-methyltransferase [Sphingobium sp. V4]|uniref:DNA-methyltransferase n=1 Tax=Sphingobium sp. V4 TaxID=3038927 RepID=UPI002557FD42|nr:site-specific DNA-methyltransferase [Sphingobium sp. V4]WIW89311.1 site-specific DNA-methyltransferase [Sphingobium sp. V4]
MLDVTTPTVVTMEHATLYLADAYALLPRLGWVDAIVTDPPYEFNTSGGGSFREQRGHTDQIAEEGLDQGFDHSIINSLLCGSVVVFCHNDQVPALSAYLQGSFSRSVLCMWIKANPMPMANKHYVADAEIYFHAWNRDHHPQGSLAEKKRHVRSQVGRGGKYGHATVKPDTVMDKIITNVAGKVICDPFMGTGSTGVAAVKAGRTFIGIEHNPKHFATAVERLRLAHEQRVHAPP